MKIIVVFLLSISFAYGGSDNTVKGYIKNSYLPSERYSRRDCRGLASNMPFSVDSHTFNKYKVIIISSVQCSDFDARSAIALITNDKGLIIKRIDLESTSLRFVKTPDELPYLILDSYIQSSSYSANNYYFYTFAKYGSKDYPSIKHRKTIYQVTRNEDDKNYKFIFDNFYKKKEFYPALPEEFSFYLLDTNIIKEEDWYKANAYQRYERETFGFSDGRIFPARN